MNVSAYPARPHHSRRKIIVVLCVIALLVAGWLWRSQAAGAKKGPVAGAVPVTSVLIERRDIPVRLSASGQVAALQSVEVRAQISATIKTVHVKEGQMVQQGERLFSLDVRSEIAAVSKAEAQLAKSRAELTNAERTLRRQQDLLAQKFVSQTAVDTAQSQAESWRAQVAADAAELQAVRVPLSHGEIHAPIAGRTGAVSVYPGSLVQPSGAALLSIAQVDPISVNFTIPERNLPAVRQAFAQGPVPVKVAPGQDPGAPIAATGQLSFIDNAVDPASGTIRLKARFANPDRHLWPGMFVTVELTSLVMNQVLTVPTQAVQNGPESRFVYVIGDDNKVTSQRVEVKLVQDGRAVIEGAPAGAKVVLEGAQNLRPGSTVSISAPASAS